MQTRTLTAALVAALSLSVAPAAIAQTAGGVVVAGLGVANQSAIVGSSNAYKTAIAQLPTVYKAQLDQANTRKAQLQAQLKPMYDKLDLDAKGGKTDRAALQAEYARIQEIQTAGERELQQIVEPVNVARQYVLEQIGDKLDTATQAAMTKRRVTIVLDSQSVLKADQAYNLNQDILDQLNLTIPAVGVTPPAGWLPRAQREQQAQAAAAAAASAPAATTKAAPQGR